MNKAVAWELVEREWEKDHEELWGSSRHSLYLSGVNCGVGHIAVRSHISSLFYLQGGHRETKQINSYPHVLCTLLLSTGVAYGQSGGVIRAWGNNIDDECEVPTPNGDFVAASGGHSHSLGLKTDGTIVVWGNNWDGRYDVPEPNADFKAIASGLWHCLGLKDDGTIVPGKQL